MRFLVLFPILWCLCQGAENLNSPKRAIDCGVEPDGLYAHPAEKCSAKYFWCFGGQIGAETCPDGEMFDPESKTCRLPALIKVCPPDVTTRVVTRRPTTAPRTTTARPTTTTAAPSDDCKDRPDGDYPLTKDECRQEFVACAEGRLYNMVCPSTTFFDEDSLSCQFAQYVKACGGRPTQKAPEIPGPKVTLPDISLNCGALKNGFYENPLEGCSRFYIACSDGVSSVMFCATADLRFDVISNECLEPAYVEWCGGNPTTRRPQVTRPPVEFDCGGKLDGYYPDPRNPCNEIYYSCSGGFAELMRCAVGMRFDMQSTHCLEPAYIRACGGTPTPTPIRTTRRPQPPDIGAVNCAGKFDGDYPNQAQACSNIFFSCSGGGVTTKRCHPASLRFDMQSGSCLEPAYIAACGGSTTPKPLPTTTVVTPIDFDCSGKSSGFYPNPRELCDQVYYACVGGVAQRLRCPASLYFDILTGDCHHRIYVKACGGTPTTRAPTTIRPITRPTPTPTIFNCRNRPDGQYEDIRNPCSSFYFICQGGQTFQKKCIRNLKWDVLDRTCKPQWQVEWCK